MTLSTFLTFEFTSAVSKFVSFLYQFGLDKPEKVEKPSMRSLSVFHRGGVISKTPVNSSSSVVISYNYACVGALLAQQMKSSVGRNESAVYSNQ